eukprot:4203841-Pleurochrysis_carterae.AAC.2
MQRARQKMRPRSVNCPAEKRPALLAWKFERPEMPFTESTTSPGTRPAVCIHVRRSLAVSGAIGEVTASQK